MASDVVAELYDYGLGDDEFIGALCHNLLERDVDDTASVLGVICSISGDDLMG